jgi:hypothetical protein
MTSLLVCGLGAVGREVTLLVSFVVAMLLMGLPPFLNGRAVFADKHALALAHASRGGKCKRRVPYPRNGAVAEWRGRSAAEVCTSAARKIRAPLVRARDGVPQEGLVRGSCYHERLFVQTPRCAYGFIAGIKEGDSGLSRIVEGKSRRNMKA